MPIGISTCDTFLDVATYLDQLKRLKVTISTAAGAREGLLYAQTSCSYTVRYVDDAREFFELPEEHLADQGVIARGVAVDERLLSRIAPNARERRKKHKIIQ
jgi:hypothetical protein